MLRVDDRIKFLEGADIEIDHSTFCPNGGIWVGFRSEFNFSDPTTISLSITNSFFYDTAEFIHIAFKPGSKFIFNNNYVQDFPDATTHMMHLVDFNMTDEFSFYGNTLISQDNYCLAINGSESVDANHWKIGDNNQGRNTFITKHPSGNAFATNIAVDIAENYFKVDFENSSFDGGLIAVKQAAGYNIVNFNNCTFSSNYRTGYEKQQSASQTSFINCQFVNNNIGIHLMGEDNLTIDNCSFSNNTGIKISLASQAEGSIKIINSTFSDQIDIHSTGAFFDAIDIENSNFFGTNYGIFTDGENNYKIANNDFSSSYLGAFHLDNGSEDNIMKENNIGGFIGIHTQGNNNDFKFLDNCFQTYGEGLNSLGSVQQFMGDQIKGAGNCFTPDHIDINHEGMVFDYFVPEEEYGTCHEPLYESDYSKSFSVQINEKNCGSDYIPPSVVVLCYLSWNPTCADVLAALAHVNQEISNVEADDQITEYIKSIILNNLKRCKRYIEIQKLRKCKPISNHELSLGFGFGMKAKYIALLISDHLYQEALTYINTLSETDEEAIDYIDVQRINIQRLSEAELFTPTNNQIDFLRSAGQKSFPLAAYARGLLTILTGEVLYPEIILANRSTPRESTTNDADRINIYPNPVNDLLTIASDDMEDCNDFIIINMNGQVEEKGHMIGNLSIDISHLPRGIYMVKVKNSKGLYHISKITKI